MAELPAAASPTTPPPSKPLSRYHTRGTWTPERARELGKAGREKARLAIQQRVAIRKRIIQISTDPPSTIPPILREQIAGATLQLKDARAAGNTRKVKEWIQVIKQLVQLERLVSQGEDKPTGKTRQSRSDSKPLPAPWLPPAGQAQPTPSPSPTPTSDPDPDPIPSAPLD